MDLSAIRAEDGHLARPVVVAQPLSLVAAASLAVVALVVVVAASPGEDVQVAFRVEVAPVVADAVDGPRASIV